MKETAGDLGDKAKDLGELARGKFSDTAEVLGSKAKELGEHARGKLDDVSQVVRDGAHDLGKAVKEGRETFLKPNDEAAAAKGGA